MVNCGTPISANLGVPISAEVALRISTIEESETWRFSRRANSAAPADIALICPYPPRALALLHGSLNIGPIGAIVDFEVDCGIFGDGHPRTYSAGRLPEGRARWPTRRPSPASSP